ncbi:hypothetical protein [Asanoa iriomotensis]|uniref:Integral membrane protein n=1 Tax=Asanoa iriomotensis TaxID=234613 RepID=A0ABQ4C6U5_9ACTN|nr:hypothetical protein [Asanoa iriomotensis]GIF58501.1 hypothetical protein Air01nite_45960 [Asanoa iriomotensis]
MTSTLPVRTEPPMALTPPAAEPVATPVGGPARSGWREATLTRAKEIESLAEWIRAGATERPPGCEVLLDAIRAHLAAARGAALRRGRGGAPIERARTNLDAAEALLLDIAPPWYLLGTIPSVLGHAQRHLIPTDPRRRQIERVAQALGITNSQQRVTSEERLVIVARERGSIAAVLRAASSAAHRELVRLRSFRNVVVATTVVLATLVVAVAVAGFVRPEMVPLCFAPEDGGQAIVVCPTRQSAPFPAAARSADASLAQNIDLATAGTVRPYDALLILVIGLIAAAVAAAAAVRGIRGSSERYGVPVALALLKLPTGALTAFLGLLLMRGQFVPGLSALDTSAQILAWALVFGYAQQLFTRLVDQQGHAVLDSVRGANTAPVTPP